MSKTPTSSKTANPLPQGFDDGGMDWAAFDALTDKQVAAASDADADAQPLSEAQLARARRPGLAGVIRLRLGLTHAQFEQRYHIPADTLLDWELGRSRPDAALQAYLTLIAGDPVEIAARLAANRPPVAAE